MFTIRVTFQDGAVDELRTLPIDLTNWETDTGRQLSDLAEGVAMGDLTRMAWSAAARSKLPNHRDADGKRLPYGVWLADLVDVDFSETEAAELTPTPPGASPG